MTRPVQAGVWQHWKGGREYLVLGLGHDANVPDREVVVYVPLYPVDGPRLAVRTVLDFLAWVDPATGAGAAESDAGAVARFTYRGDR